MQLGGKTISPLGELPPGQFHRNAATLPRKSRKKLQRTRPKSNGERCRQTNIKCRV